LELNVESLLQRLNTDIGYTIDSYGFIFNVALVNDTPVRIFHKTFVMKIHAFRIILTVESLLKLVSVLKKISMFSRFASLNDHVDQRPEEFSEQAEKIECILSRIEEEAVASLKELESHDY
ncbi:mediator of RNA polymerase II transcription subunit 22b-like, partial [Capsicum annuum]|uniref:mediator of RNA polymerase II transcription subunit 22b-like n=1 Tax=Capsicum annuum TaxID=4072 RepID=UPI001FB183DC